jgi:hypothetical protein
MSVGPMGFFSSIAATPLPHSKGNDADRAAQETAGQSAQTANAVKAENAAGIGETDGQEHGPAERDADGRRIWEKSAGKKHSAAQPPESSAPTAIQSKDATGDSGTQLDLTG